MNETTELLAATPTPLDPDGFNPLARLPYGLTTEHVQLALQEFLTFLGYINQQLVTRELARLECMLMPANFSSLVGEFLGSGIPKYCPGLVRNRYHNGYPDMLPAGFAPNDRAQHANQGIEVKASRSQSGWQGHNRENGWFLIAVFDANRAVDATGGVAPFPFRFLKIVCAELVEDDWQWSGRSATSRRTPTSSIIATGYGKMMGNWVYQDRRRRGEL